MDTNDDEMEARYLHYEREKQLAAQRELKASGAEAVAGVLFIAWIIVFAIFQFIVNEHELKIISASFLAAIIISVLVSFIIKIYR